MKKLFIALLLTVVGLAFTAPAFALENEFGGYWRTRMYTQKNFSGNDSGSDDIARADTRTSLYYTAVINDNLKFVNKFEMDAVWGDYSTYGGIGADGIAVEIKNTYAQFKLDEIGLFRVGTQPGVVQRGFVFDDDFSGVMYTNGTITAVYCKAFEGGAINYGDETSYHVNAAFDLDTVKLTPNFTYLNSVLDSYAWLLGLDIDATFGATSLWGTFIYNGGEVGTVDIEAWLAAAGATVKLNDTMDIHGQAFYATGNDPATADIEAFIPTGSNSYYWAEIMGSGTFDNQVSNNSPGGAISNITALNLGVTFAATDKLKVSADLWYARLNEATINSADNKCLGTEIDLKATYQVVDGLNLDLVGAYLFAGDATTVNAVNDENPWEVGTRLSLSF